MIVIKGLCFSYDNNIVFKNINCDIEKGKLTCILGKNGSGKSTLLKILSGQLKNYSGQIFVNEHNLKNYSLRDLAKLIGYLPQFHNPIYPYKVIDVVVTGRMPYFRFYPSKNDIKVAHYALERLNIENFKERKYTDLSGGEQKLVLLARVIAQSPKIIVLDEPLTNLDLKNQIKILNILKGLVSEGITIISVIHEIGMAFLFSDEILFIKKGEVIKKDKNNVDNSFLESIFEVPFKIIFENKKYILPDV
ncbi:MAG: ABC transporter ATP-binding protein [Proteobacteria bacterium]|nr:ABC transporter ATP-binding protein [Pseudomonadota bacterium]